MPKLVREVMNNLPSIALSTKRIQVQDFGGTHESLIHNEAVIISIPRHLDYPLHGRQASTPYKSSRELNKTVDYRFCRNFLEEVVYSLLPPRHDRKECV